MGTVAARLWRWVRIACPVGTAPADAQGFVRPVHLPLVNGKLVTIEVIRINGQDAPGRSLPNAIDSFRKYVAGQVRVVEREPMRLEADAAGRLSREQLTPIIAARRHQTPSDLTILLVPALAGMGIRGEFQWRDDSSSIAVMNAAGMQAGIARVLPRERWWQLVLLHEMAHALRVPADRSHTWHRGHCTRPDCVLYARIDHRSALRVLLGRQWPMDLCPLCQQEIRRAQETAGGTLIDPDQPYDHLAAVEALVSANPEHFMAYTARAAVYSDRGECERAIADYTRAIELNPEDALAWNNRSITFARMGKLDRAVEDQNRAVELEPRSAYRRRVRAGMLMQAHQFAAAISDLEQCLAQTPNDPIALTRLACVLATADAEGIRNGARAVALARRACELDQWKQPSMLDVLAAACAEAGRFDEAVAYQQRALGAFPDADPGYQQHLDLYRAGKPLRQ